MNRRSFIKTIGLITGALIINPVKAIGNIINLKDRKRVYFQKKYLDDNARGKTFTFSAFCYASKNNPITIEINDGQSIIQSSTSIYHDTWERLSVSKKINPKAKYFYIMVYTNKSPTLFKKHIDNPVLIEGDILAEELPCGPIQCVNNTDFLDWQSGTESAPESWIK